MNFAVTEEQEAVRDLADQIFAGSVDPARVAAVEATDDRFDRELWATLATANLLGIAIPEVHGGAGLGMTEVALVLAAQGRSVAPVPLWATQSAALALVAFGTPDQQRAWLPGVADGSVVLTVALSGVGVDDPLNPDVVATPDGDGWRLAGFRPVVPAAHVAEAVLVPARTPDGPAVFLVATGADGVALERAITTDRSVQPHLTLRDAPAERLGDGSVAGERVLQGVVDRALIGLCALQLGVCEAAIAQAAVHLSQREQFGRPLATFQGAQLRAADTYIDTEAIRVTVWQAAWRLDSGRDATDSVLVAKWWASQGGQRVVHHVQHLHGGLGADVEYPVHRYFLWGKQIEDTLGGTSATLARLGRRLAEAHP